MNSLFGKAIMLIGALAASVSLMFWSIYKGLLTLEIFSILTATKAMGYSKIFAAVAFVTILLMFIMFLARDRSKG